MEEIVISGQAVYTQYNVVVDIYVKCIKIVLHP